MYQQSFASARRRVIKGRISAPLSDDASDDLACEVHNASATGATLRVSRADRVPSDFILSFDDGESLACAVMRRSRIDLAVRFR